MISRFYCLLSPIQNLELVYQNRKLQEAMSCDFQEEETVSIDTGDGL